MRVLRVGARGDDVQAVQLFLRGQELYAGEVDGVFGRRTLQAVKAFQARHQLEKDGVVGIRTFGKAQELGFNPGFSDDDVSELGPNWPPPPAFTPLDKLGKERAFGVFSYAEAPQADHPEAIRIDPDWLARNLVPVEIPQLIGVHGAPLDGVIRLHRLAAQPFAAFFAAVEAAGLKPRLLAFGGSFAPRFVRGSRTALSHHAYGTAIDLNPAQNPLGALPALKGKLGSVRELVPLAHAHGLYWGGHFKRPDGMHFELAQFVASP